jgi:hypothetical protein
MKRRLGFVSNSSSCSFLCKLSLRRVEGWDWDDPADRDMIECRDCGSSFLISEIKKHEIVVHPDQSGYINSEECPICQGRVRIVVLKDDKEIERGFC